MNWLAFGYCVVAAMVLSGVVGICVSGIRVLLRRSTAFFLVFTAASSLTSITAQKTNNVNNLPPQQMMAGGWVSQTGFPFPIPHSHPALSRLRRSPSGDAFPIANPVQTALIQTTVEDIARGWRVESVTTNAAVSYVMPTNAATVGNWHVHGAASSFGMNKVDFGVMRTSGTLVPTNWSFPLGTNDEAFSSFWYFVDGRIRPMPKDADHEICAVGVPMSAVPGQSRLWRLDGDNGSRVLTWENFFFGGDTNAPVNAQIELFETGDFVTRSNDVETVCRRINPDDWDDDGIENELDPYPLFCDGDFFGPANILPEGANTNAYCTVSVVATGPDALVVFEGDGSSNYPDPRFVARHGVTNEVFILIGKTYTVSSDWPIEIVGSSDPDTEIASLRGPGKRVCRPVYISAGEGNPFVMYVEPSDLNGVFSWLPTGCGCTLSGSGVTFAWSCSTNCTCCGQNADGTYAYEGYWLPATSCLCGCYYNGEGPTWTNDNEDPNNSGPFAASVSATFSKSAVIFENAYENEPGQWGVRNPTRTRLNIVAHGGPNGAALSVAATNLGKLNHISGPGLPLAPVAIAANTSVSYAIVYEGNEASDSADDISVTATLTENVTGSISADSCAATSIRLEMSPVWAAPENPCTNRHIYGVGERVRFRSFPESVETSVQLTRINTGELSHYDNIIDSAGKIYACPIYSATPNLRVVCREAEYRPVMTIVEPKEIFSPNAFWDSYYAPCLSPGSVGGTLLAITNYVGPMNVSFHGIMVSEIPCVHTNMPSGFFATPNYTGQWTHHNIFDVGWAMATRIASNNYWTVDRAGHPGTYNNWSTGRLVWDIPIGWVRMRFDGDDMHGVDVVEHVGYTNTTTRALLIGGSQDAYQQVFSISEDGTASIKKHGHTMSRGRFCRIIVDGKTIQWMH